MYSFFCGYKFSFLLVICLQERWPGRIVSITSNRFNFNKNCPNWFPEWLYHFSFLPECIKISFAVHPHQHLTISVCVCVCACVHACACACVCVNFSHCDRYTVASHYGFILSFSNDCCFWASFHVLICHMYFFFGEMFSIQIFCQFLKNCFFFFFFTVEYWEYWI